MGKFDCSINTITSSETQLRSRLKKWRVTKPSRQTRKKSHASSGEEQEEVKRKPSIQRPLPSLQREARHDWPVQSIYGVPEDRKWSSPMVQQLTPSPSGEHVLTSDRSVYQDPSPTTTSFEQSSTSPVGEGLILNTTVPPYSSSYPLSPESCLPSPATTTSGIAWPPRSVSADYGLNPAQWYALPFEAITPPSAVPQSTAPMNPSINGYMPPGQYQAQYHYPEGDYHYDKNWRRAMSLQYDMHGHAVREREGERKMHSHSMPSASTQPGSHPVMCAPIMSYVGDHYAQKPPGVGY